MHQARKMSSSSEDERLSQMIKDYIEMGSRAADSSSFLAPSRPLRVDKKPIRSTLQEIMEKTLDVETEVYGKVMLYLKDMESIEKINKLKKCVVCRLQMDNYEAHLCKTSWSTTSTFTPPKGEYEYVDVTMRDKNGSQEVRLIVDMDFRTQFELARPTEKYQELIKALPSIFVGSEEKLEKLITLICSAAKRSLKDRGLHIPPWRKTSYMHSKWFSQNCKRVSFLS